MSYDWFESIGRPQFVVAPMVDASELAWRLLCRRHGATLCYTPMFHSNIFTKDHKYRKENMVTCDEDRPLIVQFCGNNPEIMAAAAKMVEGQCDAIEINLGCPQSIAKRGRYGAFLQDEWELLQKIVKAMSEAVSIPITCKVRIFESIEKSVDYALMLQKAGCKMLTVHGRTREQKGPLTGVASWKHIKAVREAISIPMLANGNIQSVEDVYRCLEYTKVDGVMSAEGILTNPALFEGINSVTWEIVQEYLDLVQQYPCPTSYVRGHLFKMFHKIFTLEENNDDRQILATAQNLNDFRTVCSNIKDKYLPYHEGKIIYENDENILRKGYDLILPPWICQPYVRMTPEEHTQKLEKLNANEHVAEKRTLIDENGDPTISKKKMRRLRKSLRRPKNLEKNRNNDRHGEICVIKKCLNPLGRRCLFRLCKKCCKDKCFEEDLDCPGHRILVHTRREMAIKYSKNIDKNTEIVTN
ncbi:unnamed protein product [Chrysodeixis includens]|uniref:DUS-like FMN-binding domain-containing protein n=1 Tax=Chrysodeixis includens TaxID=689277 RepID=A0A9N8KUZ5_CHRIL|nr:unnamed protein product [Chrysodeixis includens]